PQALWHWRLSGVLECAAMGKQALLHDDHEHDRELEALDHVKRDQGDTFFVFRIGVDIGAQRYLSQERLQRLGPVGLRVELFGQTAQLAQVLHPGVALRGAVGIVAVQARALDDVLDQLTGRQCAERRPHRLELLPEALQRYQSGLWQVWHRLQLGKNAKHIATASRGGTDYGFDADRSDLAPGHVDDACEADHVCRV